MSLKSFIGRFVAKYDVAQTKRWSNSPIKTQEKVLRSLLDKAKNTDFGKDHGFLDIQNYDDFKKVQIKVGTVLEVKKNEKARKPSLVIKVDFGKEIGIKQSSAQITHYYNAESLVGKQVIGVCNFPTKNIAGVVSEVLVLGAIEKDGKVVLVHPSQKTDNGLDIA